MYMLVRNAATLKGHRLFWYKRLLVWMGAATYDAGLSESGPAKFTMSGGARTVRAQLTVVSVSLKKIMIEGAAKPLFGIRFHHQSGRYVRRMQTKTSCRQHCLSSINDVQCPEYRRNVDFHRDFCQAQA